MKTERGEKLAAILHDKTEYAMHIRNSYEQTCIFRTFSTILEISKIFMYKLWFDYVKPKWIRNRKVVLYGSREFYCIHKNR